MKMTAFDLFKGQYEKYLLANKIPLDPAQRTAEQTNAAYLYFNFLMLDFVAIGTITQASVGG